MSLLPSAALQGVVVQGDDEREESPKPENELMQVQCRVLNASRLSATPA